MAETLFPTTVIGSLPRPAWVRDVILDRKEGRLSEDDATRLLDPAVETALRLQERCGLEEITDGEWRRESYVKVFAARVRGFRDDLISVDANVSYPAVVEPIDYWRPLAVEEIKFARPRTTRRLKATIPAPYILGRRMWHPDHSATAYARAEDFMAATVPILRREIELLVAAGADTVQLDEPWLARLVDPAVREREGTTDTAYEMDLCVDLINQTVDGFDEVATSMHLCHAHFDRRHGSEGPYDLIMPALNKVRVDTISLELATPVAGGMSALAGFPRETRLGLGCIDHCDRGVEAPEEIIAQVEEAMRYVDKERIVLHPDCGFAPSVQNPMDVDEAYLKLGAMCTAAGRLRQRYS